MKIIGTCRNDIDRTPIDYFSIGHVIFGYISYLVCFLITFFAEIDSYKAYSLVATIIIGLGWELIENTFLVKTKLKYEHRTDTIQNSLFDIIFVFIGGIICEFFIGYPLDLFIILTIVFLVSAIMLFEVCSTLTINNG